MWNIGWNRSAQLISAYGKHMQIYENTSEHSCVSIRASAPIRPNSSSARPRRYRELQQTWGTSTNKKTVKTNRSAKSFYAFHYFHFGDGTKKTHMSTAKRERGYNNKSWKLLPQLKESTFNLESIFSHLQSCLTPTCNN